MEKGDVIFGGNVNVNSCIEDRFAIVAFSEKINHFELNTFAGLFVSKNVAIGLSFGLSQLEINSSNRSGFAGAQVNSSTQVSTKYFSPFINFQSKITEKLQFNLGTEFKLGKGDSEYRDDGRPNVESIIKFVVFSITPGLYYFISKKTALVLNYGSLEFNKSNEEIDLASRNEADLKIADQNVGLNFGFDSCNIGFVFVFTKKSRIT
tara:strand:- start:48179 stop:48799 length:621 start_codon:yes stop_codon:yes gene_type:complete